MTDAKTKKIIPGPRSGSFTPPVSKSDAHRRFLSAALSDVPSVLACGPLAEDLQATLRCLASLGADIQTGEDGRIRFLSPINRSASSSALPDAELPCGESGSTLRFLLPVSAAIGRNVLFRLEGRLPERPMSELIRSLREHGASIEQDGSLLHCTGRIQPGSYRIPGNISSQFVSGLLFALPLLDGESALTVEGPLESSPYVRMTEHTLRDCGIRWDFAQTLSAIRYRFPGEQRFRAPARPALETDWSGAAPFFCLGACHPSGVKGFGLSETSAQGDKKVLDILEAFGADVLRTAESVLVRRGTLTATDIDASQIPDLVPVLAALASGAEGITRIHHAGRLRQKESDRLKTTASMLRTLGATLSETEDGLLIEGQSFLEGGETDSFGDHRIAMAAAVAASFCRNPVFVRNPGCVAKSFPSFWAQFDQLGG